MTAPAPVFPLVKLTGLAIAAAGTVGATVVAFTQNNWTAIIVAVISAAGVVIAGHNGRRIRLLEKEVRRRRVVAISHRPGAEGPDGDAYDEDEEDTTEGDW